jgi:hypothetical protein
VSLLEDLSHYYKKQTKRDDCADTLRKDFGFVPFQPVGERVEPKIMQFDPAYSAPRESSGPTMRPGGARLGYLSGFLPQASLNLPGQFGRRLWRGQRS